ncbi:MAG: hypothetical protein H7062_22305 [Candidatus Saccharimonas sp.]|nr:hypothetical protein [Planctomycetaceae bacterium]
MHNDKPPQTENEVRAQAERELRLQQEREAQAKSTHTPLVTPEQQAQKDREREAAQRQFDPNPVRQTADQRAVNDKQLNEAHNKTAVGTRLKILVAQIGSLAGDAMNAAQRKAVAQELTNIANSFADGSVNSSLPAPISIPGPFRDGTVTPPAGTDRFGQPVKAAKP